MLTKLQGYSPANGGGVPAFNMQFPYAHVRPRSPTILRPPRRSSSPLQEALTGQKTAKQALDDAAAKWWT